MFDFFSFQALNNGYNIFPIGITAKHFFSKKLDIGLIMDYPLADVAYLDSKNNIPHSFYTEVMGNYAFFVREKEANQKFFLLDNIYSGYVSDFVSESPALINVYTAIKIPVIEKTVGQPGSVYII